MTLKEALNANFQPYFIYGKILTSQNASFRLEQSLYGEDKVYVSPEVLKQIHQERVEVLEALEKFALALQQANPLAVDLLVDQKIED